MINDEVSENKSRKKNRLSIGNIISWILTDIFGIIALIILVDERIGCTLEGAILIYFLGSLSFIYRGVMAFRYEESRTKGTFTILEVLFVFVIFINYLAVTFPSYKDSFEYHGKKYVTIMYEDGPYYYALYNPFIYESKHMTRDERLEIYTYKIDHKGE